MKEYIIYSDCVWVKSKIQPASIHIKGGKIEEISLGIHRAEAMDYTGNLIMPGVIDAHVHINEPGRTEWEGFETATKAAATGGITTVIDMPLNSSPVITDTEALQEKLQAAYSKLFVNCGFWAGAINASVNEVKSLKDEGCLGVKVFLSHSGLDEFPNITLSELEQLMKGIKNLNIPVLAHCELDSLDSDKESLQKSPRSYDAYLKSRPKLWENQAVKEFINLSQKYNCRAHIVHLASEEIIDWLVEMKKKSVPFTVETCPHYLLFNAESIKDGETIYKCAPPIRKKNTSSALKKAIKSGLIDFVSSDHSPAPSTLKGVKDGDFNKAWGGISGLQFLLSASWTALKDELSLEEFIPLLTLNPAQFLGLEKRLGKIEKGFDADITIWLPDKSFKVLKKNIAHKHKITPYLNHRLYGEITTTIVNGKIAYENGKVSQIPHGNRLKNQRKLTHIS